jgi:hypothetical protein
MSAHIPRAVAVAAATACLVLPASALAAPPSNDNRANARELSLPASLNGTTVESTLEADEPGSCAPLKGSVWYSLTAASDARIVVGVDNGGDLDGTLEVFERRRSQLRSVTCERTDEEGKASFSFKPTKGVSYVVRVGQLSNSVPGTFRLDAFAPEPPARGPGPQLPGAGVTRTLDSVQDTDDAFSYRMRSGTSYRVNLAASGEEGCVALELYPPGTRDFEDASPVRRLRCGGYILFTPGAGEGGRYSMRAVAAPRRRGAQRYHLQAAPALSDDTAPGLFLGNYQRARGSLAGRGVDVVDLYRFDVVRRSDLKLALSGGDFELVLLTDRGHRIESTSSEDGGDLSRRISPGRYFAAVRSSSGASGRYSLTRTSRTITSTRISMEGRSSPGRRVPITVRVSPGASGPVTVTIQRFDPLGGWLFFRQVRTHSSGGTASAGFTPTGVGRWRARAEFAGSRGAAPSETGFATVLVAGPLRP